MSDAQCLTGKLTIAGRAIEAQRRLFGFLQCRSLPRRMMGATIAALTLGAVWCPAQQLANGTLSVTVNQQNGDYQFGPIGGQPTLQSSIGALVDHKWLHPSSYPSHSVSESPFSDALGSGRQLTVTCSGLAGSPDLIYVLQLYTENPYGTIQVRVKNGTQQSYIGAGNPQC